MMYSLHKVPVVKKAANIWQRGRTSIFHLQNYTRTLAHSPFTRCGILRY